MVILIDTNIILDYLILRKPFNDAAEKILNACFQNKITGYIAAHSITNIFYILRKHFSASERKKLLFELCEFIEIAGIQKKQILDSLANKSFEDLEDRLQVECAQMINADFIVTRNITDFLSSEIPPVLPDDLIKIIDSL